VPIAAWLASLPDPLPLPTWGGDFVRAACANAASAYDPAAARLHSRSLGRWRIETAAAREGFVTLTESQDAGWSVEVDGRAAPIIPYLRDFQAAFVPAGKHTVEWSYRPRGWIACVAASILGLALCAAAFAPRRRKDVATAR
jgi:hypothetical protein